MIDIKVISTLYTYLNTTLMNVSKSMSVCELFIKNHIYLCNVKSFDV